MRKFHLYAFSDSRITVITRGENEDQAMSYACRDNGAFKRGVTVFPLNELPINAADLYSETHAPGWLYRPPFWVRELEEKEAIQLGVSGVMDRIISGAKLPVMLYSMTTNQHENNQKSC